MSSRGPDLDFTVDEYVDPEGRRFPFVHLDRNSGDLVVHFSAFFGAWGNARPYRETFGGYFHRLKMLGSATEHSWLFLCDPYGAFENGSYYCGERGDFFVERAMSAIIERARGETPLERVVTVGSSMGATAALKWGLLLPARGVVAITPHIDLDVSARFQNREAEVAFICPDGDPFAEANFPYTRQVRRSLDAWPSASALPHLFVQSCEDDRGVHQEQVVPLVEEWRSHGGRADLDARPHGGHTSDYATRELLLDVVGHILDGTAIPVDAYADDPRFRGELTKPPVSHRLRRAASLTRKRLLRAVRRSA